MSRESWGHSYRAVSSPPTSQSNGGGRNFQPTQDLPEEPTLNEHLRFLRLAAGQLRAIIMYDYYRTTYGGGGENPGPLPPMPAPSSRGIAVHLGLLCNMMQDLSEFAAGIMHVEVGGRERLRLRTTAGRPVATGGTIATYTTLANRGGGGGQGQNRGSRGGRGGRGGRSAARGTAVALPRSAVGAYRRITDAGDGVVVGEALEMLSGRQVSPLAGNTRPLPSPAWQMR